MNREILPLKNDKLAANPHAHTYSLKHLKKRKFFVNLLIFYIFDEISFRKLISTKLIMKMSMNLYKCL